MTGTVVSSSTSANVLSATCEMSTITPRRFSSRTTSLPKSVSPLCAGLSVDESAQSLFLKWRQREIADAEPGVVAQRAQVVVDHVAAFHAHQGRDLLVGCGPPDIRRGGREDEIVRVRSHRFVHAVDQLQRALHGRRTRHIARDPDGEEQGVEPALAHPRDVDVAVRMALADVEGLVEEQPLRRVVMRVDDDRAGVDVGRRGWRGRSRLSRSGIGGGRRRLGTAGGDE